MAFPSIADIFRQDKVAGALPISNASGPNSELILSVRGTFYAVRISDTSSPGMYAIDELSRFISTQVTTTTDPDSSVPPVLITGIDFNQMDITSEMPCLNNVKVFYSFGQNFGQVQITGEVLLGPLGQTLQHNRGFKLIYDFFHKHRVSRSRLPIAISIASESYFVYLKGLKVGQIDPGYHIMPFALFGTLLDINKEGSASVNPQSTVITTGKLDSSSLISAIQASKPEDLVLKESPVNTVATDGAAPKGKFDLSTGDSTGASPTGTANATTNSAGNIASAQAAIIQRTASGTLTPAMVAYKNLNEEDAYLQSKEQQSGFVVDSDTLQKEKDKLANSKAVLAEQIVRENNGQTTSFERPALDPDTMQHFGLQSDTDTEVGVYRAPSYNRIANSPFGESVALSLAAKTPPKTLTDQQINADILRRQMIPTGY